MDSSAGPRIEQSPNDPDSDLAYQTNKIGFGDACQFHIYYMLFTIILTVKFIELSDVNCC